MSTTAKVTVVLNSMGQVTGASRHLATAHAEVTSGMVADLGQTVLELEVPADVMTMEGDKLLSHLAEHASVKSATARFAAAASGEVITTGTI